MHHRLGMQDTQRKLIIALAGIAYLAITSIAHATPGKGELVGKITRLGLNLYQVDDKPVYVLTSGCGLHAHAEPARIAPEPRAKADNGASHARHTTLTLIEGQQSCKVRGVYAPAEARPGTEAFTVRQVADNWYEVFGQQRLVQTRQCQDGPLVSAATLKIPATGPGVLTFEGGKACIATHVYQRRRL